VFTLSEGDVLELGTGYFSSLVLKWLAEVSGRNVYAYESGERWYRKAKVKESKHYKVFYTPSYDNAPIERHWGMALIDHAPDSRRTNEIERLANYVDYMVIHDTNKELDKRYHYSKIWNLFKYRYDFELYYPSTTVVSNLKDLKNIK
jgi:hypothetical protein